MPEEIQDSSKDEVRYTLGLPPELYAEIAQISERENITLKRVIIVLLRIGIFIMKAQDKGAELLQRIQYSSGKVKDIFIKFIM